MQDTAVCSEPVSQASRATMGLSQARAGTCQVLLMGGLWPVQRRLRCAHERDLRVQGRLRCAHERALRAQGRLRCAHEQDLPAHGRALRVHGRAGPLYGLSMY